MSKTIQGLNLESQFTTVKIELKGKDIGQITKLLDTIRSFHPIFFKEYVLSSDELSIRSKLPAIWRESEEYIQKLSSGEITYEKAYEGVVDTVIAKRVKSMSTIPLLHAAHNKNIETNLAVLNRKIVEGYELGYSNTFNRYYVIGCGKGSQITGSIASSKDAAIAQKIQRDKWSTNAIIERLGLPIPKWQILEEERDIEKIWKEYQKPVVIKPTGLTGGKGVTVGIESIENAKKAFNRAKKETDNKVRSPWQTKIMIQEQVAGEDYRLLVINGKLEVATKRIPAFIVGDGKKNIKELIEETNLDPRRDITNPAHILKPIIIDEPLLDLLEKNNLTLESIPEKDMKVFVRNIASMSQGGITEDCTDNVSKEIKILVESIAQSIHAFTLGVDVMCKDLSKPLTKENGAILEINTMPEAYLNLFPVLGTEREYVAERFVDGLLSENKCNKYVVVGQSMKDIPTTLRKWWRKDKDQNIGEIIDDRYYINGIQINYGLERWHAFEAIKCNASLDTIILHHRDWNSVKEDGLGFDHINTLYITKDMTKEKEYIKLMKKYKSMKLIDNIKII